MSMVLTPLTFVFFSAWPVAIALEMYRWSLVLCSFLFFAFFGFANEARQNYRRDVVYARRSPVVSATRRSPSLNHRYFISSLREEQRRRNCLSAVSVFTTSGDNRRSSVSFIDQSLISSSVEGLHWHEPKSAAKQEQSVLPAATMPTVPSATVPPHLPAIPSLYSVHTPASMRSEGFGCGTLS
ncbi:hypothetical protein F5888DRAFT_1634174 [Russula emetica]|nr:hypothetical protein F5888DRAFT_1890709 [Russula emetica]KAF8498267.1 hypothetical protein F5888DRAFT_1634174 [Russula emetica]